jgi:hypothetical protein
MPTIPVSSHSTMTSKILLTGIVAFSWNKKFTLSLAITSPLVIAVPETPVMVTTPEDLVAGLLSLQVH